MGNPNQERAPRSPPRPRRLYRVEESPACSGCGQAVGEPHASDCPNRLPRGGYIG